MRNNYIKKTLKNGVKLYLYLDKNMNQTFVEYTIDYGSSGKWFDFYLDDKHYHVLPGCAHFLEHLLGEHSKYGNFYDYLREKKYSKNGGTSTFSTCYFFMGSHDVLDSLEKLINVVDDPVFTKEDVEETKYAIAEETKLKLNSSLSMTIGLLHRNMYKDMDFYHDSLSIIGTSETTYQIDYDMLKTCYDAFYHDENKTLLIAGNFDEKEITDYVESIYSKLKPHGNKMREYIYDNLDKVKDKYPVYNMNVSDDLVGIAFKQTNSLYSVKEMSYYLMFIFGDLFNNSSDFIQRLKKENIIIEYKSPTYNFVYDDSYFFGCIATVKNKSLFEREIVNELKTRKYSQKDFDLYIRGAISSSALNVDDKYSKFKMFFINKTYSDDFDDVDFLKTLSFDKFLEFYKTLNFDNYVVATVTSNK